MNETQKWDMSKKQVENHCKGINAHTDIHALSRIRTHDPSVRASEDSSCLRPRGHCNRQVYNYLRNFLLILLFSLS
jgi:hypothetical protein